MTRIQADPEDVYGFFDMFWDKLMGNEALDFTEGFYEGGDHRSRSLEDAQRAQRTWVLDQAQVEPGRRVLEIGCGMGNLLKRARARGAHAIGITPNPHQVAYGRSQGLEVKQLAWQDIGSEWDGDFDAVIANGSLEHYVTLAQARAGLQESIYEQFFERCAALLDRASSSARVVLTFIAFKRIPDPEEVSRPSRDLPFRSDAYHYRLLERMFRGWYPNGKEQIHRCADKRFELIEEQDGTRDYHTTTREWTRRTRRGLAPRLPSLLPGLVRWLREDPDATELLRSIWHGSWGWQFAGEDPPCTLNRMTYRLRA